MRMKSENSLLLSYFIIVVLLACTAYFLNENNLLRLQLADRESEVAAVHAEMGAKDIFVIEARQDLIDFRHNVTAVQDAVDRSREWFTNNSRMPPSLFNFTSQAETVCAANGTFALGCINSAMQEDLGFRFLSEWTDRLYSIPEMIDRGGGDCDDYSLFAMALLNSMKEDGVRADLRVGEARGVEAVLLGLGENDSSTGTSAGDLQAVYPMAMCYTISSRNEDISGHCINILSRSRVESIDELEKLNGSMTFDPQNGDFTGLVGDDFHICADGDTGCELRRDSINIVMTGDDIYEFKDGRWKSLGENKKKLDAVLGKVDGTLAMPEAWEDNASD